MRNVPFTRSLLGRLVFRRRTMAADWDARARSDARFYICTGAAGSEADFDESGRRDLRELILPGLTPSPASIVVEIGCGIGRLTRVLAPAVARVYAFDVSAEMIARARDYCSGFSNIDFRQTSGDLAGVEDGAADLVFSHIVFQHVPGRRYIRRYVDEAFRVLKPGGVFRANVDGRSRQWFRRFAADSWSGVVFSARGWRRMLEQAGFANVETSGGSTQYLWGTGRKPETV